MVGIDALLPLTVDRDGQQDRAIRRKHRMKLKIIIPLLIIAVVIANPVYAKNDKAKHLPPGLQKKADKGKPLPPGWQKKLAKGEILDIAVYERGKIIVPADSQGVVTIQIEDKVVSLIKATREIVEVLQ